MAMRPIQSQSAMFISDHVPVSRSLNLPISVLFESGTNYLVENEGIPGS